MKNCIKLMRIHHYIKNLLIFSSLIFSGQLFDMDKASACLWGFAAFCALSSAIYIINDIHDKDYDRMHSTKCNRPIASGTVSVKAAIIIAAILLIISAICNFIVFHTYSTLLLVFYLLLNLIYSFGLKNIPLVDVTILVAGFLIRVMYGAVISSITVSSWLYLTVIALAFYFAFGKRRNELINQKNTRQVLKTYSLNFLDKNMYMCLTLTNVFYALWSMVSDAALSYNKNFIFTVPIVLLICMKYSMNIEGQSDGDPVEVLLHDKSLLFLCFVYAVVMFAILYV